tara:strand:+ start:501 stop:749 length:249 start_codon:yes stop_codon:yes gene_type:complete
MSVHIRYRLYKETGPYLEDEKMTRGYTVVEANTVIPFHEVLKEFYKDLKHRAKVINIWRTPAGEANYRMEEEERLSWTYSGN